MFWAVGMVQAVLQGVDGHRATFLEGQYVCKDEDGFALEPIGRENVWLQEVWHKALVDGFQEGRCVNRLVDFGQEVTKQQLHCQPTTSYGVASCPSTGLVTNPLTIYIRIIVKSTVEIREGERKSMKFWKTYKICSSWQNSKFAMFDPKNYIAEGFF